MVVKSILKGTIAAVIAATSLVSVAYASDVACPSVEQVTGADRALNAVIRQSQKTFFVLSAQPAIQESDLGWMVVAQASASGYDAAHNSAQNDVKSVMFAAMDTAMEQQGMYICAYLTKSGAMSVMTVAQQQSGLVFNPGMLKMDAIKAKAKIKI